MMNGFEYYGAFVFLSIVFFSGLFAVRYLDSTMSRFFVLIVVLMASIILSFIMVPGYEERSLVIDEITTEINTTNYTVTTFNYSITTTTTPTGNVQEHPNVLQQFPEIQSKKITKYKYKEIAIQHDSSNDLLVAALPYVAIFYSFYTVINLIFEALSVYSRRKEYEY